MAQTAYPTSDISTGSWTDEGTVDNDGSLYTSVDEGRIEITPGEEIPTLDSLIAQQAVES